MNAVTENAVVERHPGPKDFPAMLTAWLPEIQRALPKHLSAERIARIALTAFRRNPKLGQCDPKSVFAAVIQSSQLGLEIDTLGRSYLVPYDRNMKTADGWKKVTECQFIPGWKGLVDLMNRSGQGTVWTGAVYEGDEFEWQLGDNPFCKHKPQADSGERLTHTYAVGRVKGSDWPIIEVWPISKVWKHRDRYNKVGDKHYSHDNPEMYARKVPLLQVLKYMPCSAELATAMALDSAAESTGQGLVIKDAIEGTWAPAIEPAEETQVGQPPKTGTSNLKEAMRQKRPAAPAKGAATAANGDAPYPSEAEAVSAVESAQDREEALAVADACRGQLFEALVLKAVDARFPAEV